MAREARRVPEFAAFLKERRGNRSLKSVVNQLRSVGVELTRSGLFKYEDEGRTPPAHLLRGFAFAYDVPFQELYNRLLTELGVRPLSKSDLPGHSAVGDSPSHRGGSSVPESAAQTRIRELEEKLREREARIREAEDVALHLVDLLSPRADGGDTHRENRRPPGHSPGSGSRHRKAG